MLEFVPGRLAEVHIRVARYSDIVTLAAGGGYDPAEAALYTNEEAIAKRKAIERHRAGFALAPDYCGRSMALCM
jgi:hypothetical protein